MPPSKPRDSREFVRMTITLPEDPKLLDTSDVPRCGWLYSVGIMHARGQHTDGVLRPDVIARKAFVPRRLCAELVRVGMWHEPGHDCPRCAQPPEKHVIVHDYLDHQQSREESEQARESARAAAQARWAKTPPKPGARRIADSNATRNAERNANSNAERNAEVEVEVEEERYLLTLVSRLAARDARGSQPPPAEVISAWQKLAGSHVDLGAEAAAYLRRFGDRPADDERGAWLGWLRKAGARATETAIAARPTPTPGTPHCPIHPDQPTGSKACPRCLAEAAPARTDQLRAAVRRTP